MAVTSIDKDLDALTMRMTAELDAPVARVWQLWADPRQLERWWGPPMCPATVVDHDLTPGGRVTYHLSLPDGTSPKGWWNVLRVDEHRLLEFEDGFADDAWNPDPDQPVTSGRVTFVELDGGRTRMVIEMRFASNDDMERLLSLGMEEGTVASLAQMDALVAEEART
jgi:uncharacterized protein YndB with AHSA1/START domain